MCQLLVCRWKNDLYSLCLSLLAVAQAMLEIEEEASRDKTCCEPSNHAPQYPTVAR